MQQQRSRSVSRLSSLAPQGIYERSESVLSTKLPIRMPDIYDRSRSMSVGPRGHSYIDPQIPLNFYDGARLRRRARSVDPYYDGYYKMHYFPLRATTPYCPYSLYDVDYYDRFSERLREPATIYPTIYPRIYPSDTFVTRYLSSIDRIGRVNERMRELDYLRSLRSLRLHTPTNVYRWSSSPWEWLSAARYDVQRAVHSRVPGFRDFKINNPRDYYGRSYINMESSNVDRVRSRYNYLERNVDQKPSAWNAEDQVERGQTLLELNDNTLPGIYESMNIADNSREDLLMDRAGVVPRFHKMTSDFTRARFSAEHSKRVLNDFKRLKEEVLSRISSPWSLTQFS